MCNYIPFSNFNSRMYTDCKSDGNKQWCCLLHFNSRMYTDCKLDEVLHGNELIDNFNSRMYTDCKGME